MLLSYNWLKEYLGEGAPSADEVVELLTFHSFEIEETKEVGDDVVIDVDVLPNRSSDCLSHRGIAKEISTITGNPLEYDPLRDTPELPKTEKIFADIEDKDACPRFTASLLSGIKVGPSPKWLQERLEAIGQRPINNVVDATNYVMYALGQPLHAYDADKFKKTEEGWQFGVRYSKEGETISLLAEGGKDEERVLELTGSELLITEKVSDKPIGLAGVKGGSYAGVDENTQNIIIEAAHFDPSLTRKTARKAGIVIDASKRFENEPSRELPPYAQKAILALLGEIAEGEGEGFYDHYLQDKPNHEVVINPEKANSLLGLSLSVAEMTTILNRADIETRDEGGEIIAKGPFERTDLNIEEDFIEEIGRIYGYEHVEAILPKELPLTKVNKRHYYAMKLRRELCKLGFSEVVTSSFRKKDKIKLLNALASDKAYLRSTLTKNITETLDKNAGFSDLLGTEDTRIFELGTVFYKDESDSVAEEHHLAIGVRVKANGYSGKEDKILNQAIEKVSEVLGVEIEPNIEKGVAEINLDRLLQELPDPKEYDKAVEAKKISYKPYSVFPYVTRDIAMWVSEGVGADDVREVLENNAGPLCVKITLFDEFTKDGKTSYAFRLVFQSYEKTLTDEEVNQVMDKVYKAVAEKGWEVR